MGAERGMKTGMRNFSVKQKLAAWLTLLMVVMSVSFLIFMLSISSAVISETAITQLTKAAKDNLSQVSMKEGKLELGENFAFYHNGVSTLIYSKSKTLLAGQIPVSFKASEDFKSGIARTVLSGTDQYLVIDFWVPIGWEDGLWVRSLSEAPQQQSVERSLIGMALIALPVFILLAALGSYFIAKRTFRPLDSITETAKAITEAKDLSGRIALPPGKDEFSRLADTFDNMFERLERSFDAEKQFTADASHELRTPISVIKGACEYANKYDETPEERRETIEMIQRQAEGMSKLISQLLSITRLDQGTELIHAETLDLSEFVRMACKEEWYMGKSLQFSLEPMVYADIDSALISRLLQNLVENALKYGKAGGKTVIAVSKSSNEALLCVSDDGMGISKEDIEKVWLRFYQADASRSGENGAGLGLSMVRQIALAHGGYMTVESEIKKGSTFTLHLPLSSKR